MDRSIVVMPRVFLIPGFLWEWCKLGEACEVAKGVARSCAGNRYEVTLEQFILDWVAIVRPNRSSITNGTPSKVFKYSPDGWSVRFEDIPWSKTDHRMNPPWTPFSINFSVNEDLFVSAQWISDVLRAISLGAVLGRHDEDGFFGQTPRQSEKRPSIICLDWMSKPEELDGIVVQTQR